MRKILLPQLVLYDPGMSCDRMKKKIPGVRLINGSTSLTIDMSGYF
jgi:hypothetical protein